MTGVPGGGLTIRLGRKGWRPRRYGSGVTPPFDEAIRNMPKGIVALELEKTIDADQAAELYS
jgi:hypothetical protein